MKASYTIINFKLVYTLMIRDYWDKTGTKMSPLRALLTFVFLEIPALLTERYCVQKFDHLIAGHDLLAALILSIRCWSKGEATLIYHCKPDDKDYATVMREAQKLITPADVVEIEKLIGYRLGKCKSFDDLLQKLGAILSDLNSKSAKVFVAQNCRLVNSSASRVVKEAYSNICWAYYQHETSPVKRHGLIPFTIKENPNKWFHNYQCAFSFNDAIILTKLNESLSPVFFDKPLIFSDSISNLRATGIYSSKDRISDIKSLIAEFERRE